MGLVRFIAELSSPFRRHFRFSTDDENAAHALGRYGERLAAKHLRRNGYKVLYRNFRHPRGGEVDIVCRHLATNDLVFIEVKARQTCDYGAPSHAVGREKRELIARGAVAWLRLLEWPDIRFRFDIVEVVVPAGAKPEINIVENAFPLPEPYRV
jgi:putative endonuclease